MTNGERKKCLLGMPGYGDITAGAARTFYRATGGSLLLRSVYQEGSLLALNMNRLWCKALNDAKRTGLDYFAMQHSDIQAEDFWLDRLIEELEARDLDVLGVVVPIKDRAGITSTALARPDGDPWEPHARLTMAEVYRLPETFTSEDLGYDLLINSGLWVCRFKEEWARKVHFTIKDRIVVKPDGDYVPQVESEDWYVSRVFHGLGLKVGCTRKVAVGHRGPAIFENTGVWGEWRFDRNLVESSPLGKDWFPGDVDGWLTEQEGRELAELAAGKMVLEIGSYCGRSTICLAQKARAVYAVDPFDGRATPVPADTLPTFRRNLQRYGVDDRVTPIRGTSAEVLPDRAPVFDVVFVDGNHAYEAVREDIRLARTVLRPGGLLVFHDYASACDPGVKQAVDEMLAAGGDVLRRVDSLLVTRPAAAESLATVGG